MAQIKWNNVDALTNTHGITNAYNSLAHHLTALGNVAVDYLDNRQRENWQANKRITDANTQAYLNQLNQINTPQEYQQFANQGGTNLSALNQYTNGNINGEAVNQALGSWSRDAYQRQYYRDGAKDFTPENQQAMNQYYQSLAVGDVLGAQQALGRGDFSKGTLNQLGTGMYDILNRERTNNRQESNHLMDLNFKAVEAGKLLTQAEQARTNLINDDKFRRLIRARYEGQNLDYNQLTQKMLESPEYQQATAAVNQYQHALDLYGNEIATYKQGNVVPYAPQYQAIGSVPYTGGEGRLSQSHLDAGYRKAKELGLNDTQARAVIGNVIAENNLQSKYVFGSHQDGKKRAYGAFSWQGGREQGLFRKLAREGHLDANGRMSDSPQAFASQIEYLLKDEGMNGSEQGNLRKFLNYQGNDPIEASRLFDRSLVRSAAHKNQSIANQRDRAYKSAAEMRFGDEQYIPTAQQQSPQIPLADARNKVREVASPRGINITESLNQDGSINTDKLIQRTQEVLAQNKQEEANNKTLRQQAIDNQYANLSPGEETYYQAVLGKLGVNPENVADREDYDALVENINFSNPALNSALGNQNFIQNLPSDQKEFNSAIDGIASQRIQALVPRQLKQGDLLSKIPADGLEVPSKFEIPNQYGNGTVSISADELNKKVYASKDAPLNQKGLDNVLDQYFQRDGKFDNNTIRGELTEAIKATRNPALVLHLYKSFMDSQFEIDKARNGGKATYGDLDYTTLPWQADNVSQGKYFLETLNAIAHTRPSDWENLETEKDRIRNVAKSHKNSKAMYGYAEHLANQIQSGVISGKSESALKDYLNSNFLNSSDSAEDSVSPRQEKIANEVRKVLAKQGDSGIKHLARVLGGVSTIIPQNELNTKFVSPVLGSKESSLSQEELKFVLENLHTLREDEQEEILKKLPGKIKGLKIK